MVSSVGKTGDIRSCYALNGKSFKASWSSTFAFMTSSLNDDEILNKGARTLCIELRVGLEECARTQA